MNVEQAQAQLTLAKAEEKYQEAKATYRSDPSRKAAFEKARSAVIAARDEWRNNWRAPSAGPGDASATPESVSVSLEVN